MKYRVELMSNVYVTVEVEADSYDEAVTKADESLPRYPVAVVKADQTDGRPNPVDPDDISVSKDWEVNLVQDENGDEVWV